MTNTCHSNLDPGGYLEVHDVCFPIEFYDGCLEVQGICPVDCPGGRLILEWTSLLGLAARNLGRPLDFPRNCKRWMEEAGFRDIEERKFAWHGTGPTTTTNGCSVETISMRLLTRGLGWSRDEVVVYCAKVRKELICRRVPSFYWKLSVC